MTSRRRCLRTASSTLVQPRPASSFGPPPLPPRATNPLVTSFLPARHNTACPFQRAVTFSTAVNSNPARATLKNYINKGRAGPNFLLFSSFPEFLSSACFLDHARFPQFTQLRCFAPLLPQLRPRLIPVCRRFMSGPTRRLSLLRVNVSLHVCKACRWFMSNTPSNGLRPP